ncbi:MAG TPA: type 1 glutamine amidotransferase [Acidimicrobiia bacterium]
MGTRVGLLMVGHVPDASRHIAGDYPELFATLLRGHAVELVPYQIDEGSFPESVDECDAWLCSPSADSTFDALPWRADAEALLREIVARERPFVGICFGHQLMAQALGAEVSRSDLGWQLGVQDYDVLRRVPSVPDRLVTPLALIASHRDQVQSVPDGAALMARTEGCPIAGLAIGERAWTLQPHPEFTAALAGDILAGRGARLGNEVVRDARASLDRPTDSSVVAGWMAATLTSR